MQSLVTLKGLLASGQKVSLIAVSGSSLGLGTTSFNSHKSYIPVIDKNASESILSVAAEQGIPVELLDRNNPAERLQPYAPDVGIVSCYPYRLQSDLLQLPRFGCYNLHPSLLPKYRGPAPLFWQFRHGESETGVTLHQMDHRIDAGDIVAQVRLPMSDAISETDLSRQCATRGVALIQSVLQQLEQGLLKSSAQNAQQASYYGWPNEQDFHIKAEWPARQIHNFICGTRHWGNSYTLHLATNYFKIGSVEGFSMHCMQDKQYIVDGNRIRFNCYDGCVIARLAD